MSVATRPQQVIHHAAPDAADQIRKLASLRSLRVESSCPMVRSVDALNEALIARFQTLDDEELRFLSSIKEKLNSGLDARLKDAADTVGGFVW